MESSFRLLAQRAQKVVLLEETVPDASSARKETDPKEIVTQEAHASHPQQIKGENAPDISVLLPGRRCEMDLVSV